MITRRSLLFATALAPLPWRSLAQLTPPQPTSPVPAQVDAFIQAYMHRYGVPALSLAYGRSDRMILARAYGVANARTHQPAVTESLFRIASLSKAVTSAAIFTLIQGGKLQLSRQVFGQNGILRQFSLPSPRLQQIAVHHLLTHTSGGWGNKENDPMFHNHDRQRSAFLQHTLEFYPLENTPGTVYAYSNFGYFLLGRIIEQISGEPYAEYVQQHVLHPLGITDMLLGHQQPVPQEVHYYSQGAADPSNLPMDLHDANGGWIATASDLVHFALGVFSAADNSGASALFTQATLAQLMHPSSANPHYACGWGVSPEGDYTHTGSLPGTTTLLMHRHNGLAWSILTNTQRPHSNLEEDLRQLSWNIARALPGNGTELGV